MKPFCCCHFREVMHLQSDVSAPICLHGKTLKTLQSLPAATTLCMCEHRLRLDPSTERDIKEPPPPMLIHPSILYHLSHDYCVALNLLLLSVTCLFPLFFLMTLFPSELFISSESFGTCCRQTASIISTNGKIFL